MDDELNEDLGDTWRDVDSDDELSPPATPVRRLLLKDRRNASIQRKGIGFNSLLLYGAFPLIMALCALCVSPIKFPNQFESFIGSSIVLLHNPSQHLVENLFPEDSITDQDDNTHSSSPSSYLWNDISAKYNYLTWMIHHYLHSLRDDTVLGQEVSERTANVPMNESIDVSASADTKNEHQGADVVSSSWWDVVGYFIGEPTAHMEQQEVSSKSERERDEVLTAAMTIKDSAINDQEKKFSGDADYSAVETSGETYSFTCYLFSYFSDAVCTSSEADGAEGVSVAREEEMNLDIDNAPVEIASGSERSSTKRDAVSKETADGVGEVSVQEVMTAEINNGTDSFSSYSFLTLFSSSAWVPPAVRNDSGAFSTVLISEAEQSPVSKIDIADDSLNSETSTVASISIGEFEGNESISDSVESYDFTCYLFSYFNSSVCVNSNSDDAKGADTGNDTGTVLGQEVSERTANVPMNESIDVSASADTKNEHQGADVVSSSWWDVVGYFIGEPTAHMEQQEVSSKSERERDEVLTAAMTIKDSAINDQKKKFSGDADYSAVETSGETYSFICYLFSYFSDAVCTSSEADGAEGVSVSREEEMNLDIDNAAVEIASGSERSPIKRDAVSKETADGIGEVSVQEGNNVDEDVSVGESVWNALISWVRSWGFVIAFLIIAVAGVVSSSTWSEDSIHTDIDGNTYSVDAGADFQLSTMPPSFYGGAKSNFKTPRGAIRRSAAKGGTTVGRRHEAMMNYGGIDVLTYYTGQTENKRHSLLHLADEAAGSVDDIASGNENTHPYQLRSQDRSRRSRRAPDRFVA